MKADIACQCWFSYCWGLRVCPYPKTRSDPKDDDFMTEQPKAKKGRPPLTPEQKEASAAKKREYFRMYAKAHGRANKMAWDKSEKGVVSNRKRAETYRSSHYQYRISIPASKKDLLLELASKEGVSVNALFISLIKEKYDIDLS